MTSLKQRNHSNAITNHMGMAVYHATTISPSVPHQEEQQLQGLLLAVVAAVDNSITADNTPPIELEHLAVLPVDQQRQVVAAAVLQLLVVAAEEVVADHLRREIEQMNNQLIQSMP